MGEEKWNSLLNLLNDEDNFTCIFDYITSQSNLPLDRSVSTSRIEGILQEFSDFDSFTSSVDSWVRAQTQPFLSVRITEEVAQVNENQPVTKSPNENRANSLNSKKKVAPMTISSTLPSNFGQSGLLTPSRSITKQPLQPRQENQWPSLSESSIPKSSKQPIKKRITPLSSPSSQTATSGILPKSTEILPMPPVPSLIHQMSTTVKSHLDHLGVRVDVRDSQIAQCSVLEDINSQPNPKLISRLAQLYSALINSKYLPLVPAILLLSRLLSSRHTMLITGKEIVVTIESSQKFPSLFFNESHLAGFLISSSLYLAEIIQSLGELFCTSYAELLLEISPTVSQTLLSRSRRTSSFTQEEYQQELSTFLGSEQTSSRSIDDEEYIRPFHEERDNRHEYRGKIEGMVYNEREKCFDEFSNLFRKYIDISRSDLDGSKTEEFWPLLAQVGSKILTLNDSNFLWFAQIFKDMLLFYGTNLPKGSIENPSDGWKLPGNSEGINPSNQTQFRQLEERLRPGGGAQGVHSSSHRSSTQTNEKLRLNSLALKDPSSHFPGHQQFFFRFLLILNNGTLNHHLSEVLFEEILNLTDVLSTGCYKNFIRDLRTGNILSDSLTAEMINPDEFTNLFSGMYESNTPLKKMLVNYSPELSASLTPKHLSFNIRILRLQILGKFLGLLHSYPFWTLSMTSSLHNKNESSPLTDMICRAACFRNNINPENIPLSKLLYFSWKDSTLTLTMPWVINYFQMTAWDRTSILHTTFDPKFEDSQQSLVTVKNEHINTIAILYSILKADEYNFNISESLSKNRLYVIIVLQGFFSDFPSLNHLGQLLGRLIKIPVKSETSQVDSSFVTSENRLPRKPETIDDGNATFTEIFLKHVIPALYNMYIILQQRKGWAHHILKKKSSESSAIIKRVMPTTSAAASSLRTPPRPSKIDEIRDQSTLLITPTTGLNRFPSPIKIQLSPNSSTTTTLRDTAESAITFRLETAFWQSQPQLQQLSLNFIQHLNSSCQKRMKEKVAEMVVKAWSCCDSIKKNGIQLSSTEFEAKLDSELTTLLSFCSDEVELSLKEVIDHHFEKTLSFQFEMYPLAPGILSTAKALAGKQADQMKISNSNYFLTYASKKINEVKSVCLQQRQKRSDFLQKQQNIPSAEKPPENIVSHPDLRILVGSIQSIDDELRCCLDDFFRQSQLKDDSVRSLLFLTVESDSVMSPTDDVNIFYSSLCTLSIRVSETHSQNQMTPSKIRFLCGFVCRKILDIVSIINKRLTCSSTSLQSHPSRSYMIPNALKFALSLFGWCADVPSTFRNFPIHIIRELSGRLKIEIMKFLTEMQRSLFYYDEIVSSLDETQFFVGSSLRYPSDLILEAYRLELVSMSGLIRLFSSSAAMKMNHYLYLFIQYELKILQWLQRYLMRFHWEIFNKWEGSCCLGKESQLNASDWYRNRELQDFIKDHISSELSYLIDQLADHLPGVE